MAPVLGGGADISNSERQCGFQSFHRQPVPRQAFYLPARATKIDSDGLRAPSNGTGWANDRDDPRAAPSRWVILPGVGEDRTGRNLDRALTVAQAADALGVSQDAVRKRVRRGTIRSERDEAGRVYVYVPASDRVQDKDQDTDKPPSDITALISELREQVAYLRQQLEQANERDREHRRLLAAALERMPPQIEGPRESPLSSEDTSEGVEGRSLSEGPETGTQRPWWRRIFGV
jgi:excisionase family DNA binding protein